MSCKITTVVGNTGDPSVADTQIAVPTCSKRRPLCNCYKLRGKHRPGECTHLEDTRRDR